MLTFVITDILYEDYAEEIEMLSDLLTGGLNSILKSILRQKENMIYTINSGVYHNYGISYFSIETSTDPKNAQKAVIIILKEITKLKNHGINSDDFKRIKKKRIIDNLQPESKSPTNIMRDIALSGLYDYDHILPSSNEIIETIKKVKLKTLNGLLEKVFNINHLNVFIHGNVKEVL